MKINIENVAEEKGKNISDAFYNIGVIYFNRGVKQFDVANAVPTNEQAKFEAEKKKSETIVESIADPVIVTDQQGSLILMNQAAAAIALGEMTFDIRRARILWVTLNHISLVHVH